MADAAVPRWLWATAELRIWFACCRSRLIRACTTWAAWALVKPVLEDASTWPLCNRANSASNWAIWFRIWASRDWAVVPVPLVVPVVEELLLAVDAVVVDALPWQFFVCAWAGIANSRQPPATAQSRDEPNRLRITDSLKQNVGQHEVGSRELSTGASENKSITRQSRVRARLMISKATAMPNHEVVPNFIQSQGWSALCSCITRIDRPWFNTGTKTIRVGIYVIASCCNREVISDSVLPLQNEFNPAHLKYCPGVVPKILLNAAMKALVLS